MTLAADRFRCPGSRCPDFVREGCRRFVDLKAGVGPMTPYADASLKTVTTLHPLCSKVPPTAPTGASLAGATVETVAMDWSQGPCLHKWPLTT